MNIDRRAFLFRAPLAIAGVALVAESTRRIFLPPRGGWLKPPNQTLVLGGRERLEPLIPRVTFRMSRDGVLSDPVQVAGISRGDGSYEFKVPAGGHFVATPARECQFLTFAMIEKDYV